MDSDEPTSGMKRLLKKHFKEEIDNYAPKNDRRYKNGLSLSRDPTDSKWCLVMVANLVLLLAFASYNYVAGDVNRLLAPQDASRRFCGIDKEVEDFPYVYWTFSIEPTSTDQNVNFKNSPSL